MVTAASRAPVLVSVMPYSMIAPGIALEHVAERTVERIADHRARLGHRQRPRSGERSTGPRRHVPSCARRLGEHHVDDSGVIGHAGLGSASRRRARSSCARRPSRRTFDATAVGCRRRHRRVRHDEHVHAVVVAPAHRGTCVRLSFTELYAGASACRRRRRPPRRHAVVEVRPCRTRRHGRTDRRPPRVVRRDPVTLRAVAGVGDAERGDDVVEPGRHVRRTVAHFATMKIDLAVDHERCSRRRCRPGRRIARGRRLDQCLGDAADLVIDRARVVRCAIPPPCLLRTPAAKPRSRPTQRKRDRLA